MNEKKYPQPHYAQILSQTVEYAKTLLCKESLQCTGHDWWHTYRVWRMATYIAQQEKVNVNLFVIEMAALLHDVDDWKFRESDNNSSNSNNHKSSRQDSDPGSNISGDDCQNLSYAFQNQNTVRDWLVRCAINNKIIEGICAAIDGVSFKGAYTRAEALSLEGQIVQDADRLDAMGAIGIARAFAYGGHKNREIYNPNTRPQLHSSFDEYQSAQGTTINHFYEKLLLLKDKLNTTTAKNIGEKRHRYMKQFLEQFFADWNFL